MKDVIFKYDWHDVKRQNNEIKVEEHCFTLVDTNWFYRQIIITY